MLSAFQQYTAGSCMSNLTDWIGMEEFEKLTLRGRQQRRQNLQTGGGHLTATVKNSWFRSSLLQTGQASQRASYSNHLPLHTLSHKFLYGSHIYVCSMPCYAMSGPPPPCGAGRRHLLPPPRRGHSSAIVVCGTGARRLVLALQLN